jgi:hypothetical protein
LCCLFFFFWPLCCLFFFFWPLYCLFFFFHLVSKHLHDRITSLRGEIWGDRTVLSAPLPVTSQKSEWSYICVLSEILIFDFEIVPTLWYFCPERNPFVKKGLLLHIF